MKQKPPYKIWVYNRKDGVTTFGEYINAKRHVWLSGKLGNKDEAEFVAGAIVRNSARWRSLNANRMLEFAGDPLPADFLALIPKQYFVQGTMDFQGA